MLSEGLGGVVHAAYTSGALHCEKEVGKSVIQRVCGGCDWPLPMA
jgi:hypothetical protein